MSKTMHLHKKQIFKLVCIFFKKKEKKKKEKKSISTLPGVHMTP